MARAQRSPVRSRPGSRLDHGRAFCLAGFVIGLLAPIHAQEPAVPSAPSRTPATSEASLASLYEHRSTTVADGDRRVEFRYRLMRPAAVPAGTRLPLVLFLHGAGERGDDNEKQLKYLPTWLAEQEPRHRHPCFVLAPQCRQDERWVDVSWADDTSTPQQPEPTLDLTAAVAAVDDVLARETVDPARIYLTGLSMGGYATWDLATRMPERFAAILPVCGGGDERLAARIAALPIWCVHGDADTAVPVRRSRDMVTAVIAAGGRPIYSELPGVGHDSWTPAYRDRFILDWLFSQRR